MTSENNGSRFKRWKKPLTIAFFLALIVLFTLLARRIDWSEVVETLGDFKLRTLFIASTLTLCSFLVYASFDLIGRTYIRSRWAGSRSCRSGSSAMRSISTSAPG